MAALRYYIDPSPNMPRLLIESGADINAVGRDGETILMAAAEARSLEITKLLIERGANINARDKSGMTVLMYAIPEYDNGGTFSNLSVVKFLIEKGVDIEARDNEGKTALMIAAENHNSEIISLLKQHGAKE